MFCNPKHVPFGIWVDLFYGAELVFSIAASRADNDRTLGGARVLLLVS